MGRPVDHDRRRKIARDALAWLARRERGRITMCALARGLGIKRPTLYWYYRDLGELFDAALEHVLAQQRCFFAERLQAARHPLEQLEAYMRAALAFGTPRRAEILALFRLWAASRVQQADAVLARGRSFAQQARAGLVAVLEQGIAAGQIAPVDPERLVDLVLTFCDGMAVQRVLGNERLERILDTFIESVLRPLRRTPETSMARAPRAEPCKESVS